MAIPEYCALPTVPSRQVVTLFTEELDFLSDIDNTWIMGRGIAEWLGWPL